MAKEKLMPCDECGGMVPERDEYPYPGHTKDCPTAKEWRAVHECRPVYGGLNDAVDDCMHKDEEIRQLKARLAQAGKKVTRLRQVLKTVRSEMPYDSMSSTYHELMGMINRAMRETGGRR